MTTAFLSHRMMSILEKYWNDFILRTKFKPNLEKLSLTLQSNKPITQSHQFHTNSIENRFDSLAILFKREFTIFYFN